MHARAERQDKRLKIWHQLYVEEEEANNTNLRQTSHQSGKTLPTSTMCGLFQLQGTVIRASAYVVSGSGFKQGFSLRLPHSVNSARNACSCSSAFFFGIF